MFEKECSLFKIADSNIQRFDIEYKLPDNVKGVLCLWNDRKYYEKDALVADPEYGSVLSHLLGKLSCWTPALNLACRARFTRDWDILFHFLVGPCALEYTRMKTRDHYWTDPPADELVQRHRISSGASGGGATSPANRGRPGLHVSFLIIIFLPSPHDFSFPRPY